MKKLRVISLGTLVLAALCAVTVSVSQLRAQPARGPLACGVHVCHTSDDCLNAPCPSCNNYIDPQNPGLCENVP